MALRASISVELLQASVSSVKANASITYELAHATGIWTDPDSNNRIVGDEYALSDVRFNLVGKNLTDTYTLDDLKRIGYNKPLSDATTIADEFIRTVAYKRSFNDAFTLDDLAAIDKDFYGNKGNIFAFTDIVGLTYNKNLTDSYTVSDVIAVVVHFVRNIEDTSVLTDAIGVDYSKVTADSYSLSDRPALHSSKSESDSYSLSDVQALYNTLSKTDSVSTSDTSVMSLSKIISDAFTLDDNALVNKDFYGYKGNVVGFTDILVRVVFYQRGFSDVTSVTDTPALHTSRALYDSFKVFDDPVPTAEINTQAINTNIINGQALPYSGTSSTSIHFTNGNPEELVFTELLSRASSKSLTDTVDFSNDIIAISSNKPQADSFAFTDTTTIASDLGVPDSVTCTEEYQYNFSKVLTDAFALDDSALINKDFYGNKGNIVGFTDVVEKVTLYKRTFVEALSFNEEITAVFGKSHAETFSISDTINTVLSKDVSETLTSSDVYDVQLSKNISDNLTLDDATLVDKDFYGTKGNVVSMNDLVAITKISGRLLNGAAFNRTQIN